MTSIKNHIDLKRAFRPANLVTGLMLVGVLLLLFAARHSAPWRLGNVALLVGAVILGYVQRSNTPAWLACSLMAAFFLFEAVG